MADMKQFYGAYLGPFPGLNVLTSLGLVNIQPDSFKITSPHQNFLNPALDVEEPPLKATLKVINDVSRIFYENRCDFIMENVADMVEREQIFGHFSLLQQDYFRLM